MENEDATKKKVAKQKDTAKTEPKKKDAAKSEQKKETKKRELKDIKIDAWEILQYPLMTEKSIGMIEKQNKLVFAVRRDTNKNQIKLAVEKTFNVKVDKVRTEITRKNIKKAYVKLSKEYSASDIATRLGML